MDICLYKRLAIGKHRMTRMYISKENVKQRYMERFQNNNWDESEERDNIEYLDQWKEIWKHDYPQIATRLLQEEEEGDDEETGGKNSSDEEESSSGSEEDQSSESDDDRTYISCLATGVESPNRKSPQK